MVECVAVVVVSSNVAFRESLRDVQSSNDVHAYISSSSILMLHATRPDPTQTQTRVDDKLIGKKRLGVHTCIVVHAPGSIEAPEARLGPFLTRIV
jgi:hypothetical protein